MGAELDEARRPAEVSDVLRRHVQTGFAFPRVVVLGPEAAGDWTACHLNAGCVEAAVISGMLAANAIHAACNNQAAVELIIGIDGA